MNRLLDTPLRDVLRPVAGGLVVGTVMWMPVLVALLRAHP